MKTFRAANQHSFSYEIYGDSSSQEGLLFFHGFPGSHIQGAFLDQKLKNLKMAMVAVDRPGYGSSDWVNPKDWQRAVRAYGELMDQLGYHQFSVMGVSGGSPMAHMTAHHLSDRIQQLIVVCGLAPYASQAQATFSKTQRNLLRVSKALPVSFLRLLLDKGMSSFHPEKRLSHLIKSLHQIDKTVLSAQENQELLLQSMRWARHQGSRGVVWDSQIFATDWLQDLGDLKNFEKFSTLYFHGGLDFLLNPNMSEYLHQTVRKSQLIRLPEQGHYSLPILEQDLIFSAIQKNRESALHV